MFHRPLESPLFHVHDLLGQYKYGVEWKSERLTARLLLYHLAWVRPLSIFGDMWLKTIYVHLT